MKTSVEEIVVMCATDEAAGLPRAGLGGALAQLRRVPIACFHARSSEHHPRAGVYLAHRSEAILLHFAVEDRFVIARHTRYQDPVCRDSCVEAFLEPVAGRGYFNFEFNCCGTMLASYCPVPIHEGGHTMLPVESGGKVGIYASLAGPIQQEVETPVHWTLTARIPLAVMEPYVGRLSPLSGAVWRGNFYKCADDSSHPHWASWRPVGEPLNFHKPSHFGSIRFQ